MIAFLLFIVAAGIAVVQGLWHNFSQFDAIEFGLIAAGLALTGFKGVPFNISRK